MQLHEAELFQLNLNDQTPRSDIPTRQNVQTPEDTDPQAKECQICFEARHTDLFPQTTPTSDCKCFSDACLVCVQEHIKQQMNSKEWKEGSITCPTCNRALIYQEIESYADGETLAMYVIQPTHQRLP